MLFRSGCKWRATKADYEGYPVWPSARQSVLEYFERDAHSELDMIRDECPGTAAALAEACDEHIGSALSRYNDLTDKEKTEMHEEYLADLEKQLDDYEKKRSEMYKEYIEARKAFKAYQAPTKPAKTRLEEIERALVPLNLELKMEQYAKKYDMYKSHVFKIGRAHV